MLKYGVSSYSFSRLMNQKLMNEFDIIKRASLMGFDGIDFAEIHPDNNNKLEYAKKLSEKCQECGIEVVNYAISGNLLLDDFSGEVNRLKNEVDIAKVLNAKSMRHDIAYSSDKPFSLVAKRLSKGCREVTDYAKTQGVETLIENHGFFCQDSERVLEIVSQVDDSNFGLLLDMGNFLCVDEDPGCAFGKLLPFAKHVHAKDFHFKSRDGLNPGEGFFRTRGGNYIRGAIIGHGIVPVKACIDICKVNNYDGYYTIEFEGMEDNIKAIEIGFDNLKRACGEK